MDYATRYEDDPEPSERKLLSQLLEDERTRPAQAAAIASPTAPGATYDQAEAQSMKTAVDAIRTVLTANGLTA